MGNEKYFNVIKKNNHKAEIFIYGYISSESYRLDDETSAISFKKELDKLGDVKQIDVRINSGGGHVFEAHAIYNMLVDHKAVVDVYVDGLAASAASVIAMAGDTIHMAENAIMMIHNAWVTVSGDYRGLRKESLTLEKINDSLKSSYLSRDLNISEDKLSKMMDDETWMDAETAIGYGLADKTTAAIQAVASVDKSILNNYHNVPKDLLSKMKVKEEKPVVKKGSPVINLLLNL